MFPTPNISDTKCFRHLMFPTPIFPTLNVSDTKCFRHQMFPTLNVSDSTLIVSYNKCSDCTVLLLQIVSFTKCFQFQIKLHLYIYNIHSNIHPHIFTKTYLVFKVRLCHSVAARRLEQTQLQPQCLDSSQSQPQKNKQKEVKYLLEP